MSSLSQIKDMVQQLSEAVSAAFKVDLEIIDDTLCRIAGTGDIQKHLGPITKKRELINKLLFNYTKMIVIENPGQDSECFNCPDYGKCSYKKTIYTPIEYNNNLVGVIGIIATNEDQLNIIEYNNYAILDFVDKIINLINSKIKEYTTLTELKTYSALMNTTIYNLEKGIIILNKDLKIIEINSFVEKKLLISKNIAKEKSIYELLPNLDINSNININSTNDYKEIRININGKDKPFSYLLKEIIIDNEVKGIICILIDYKKKKEILPTNFKEENKVLLDDIIGTSPNFIDFKHKISKISENDSTVLLVGETGTGKELFSRAIHSLSKRKYNPFIAINCGAIPENLIESELFGYEKGAFTGAKHSGKMGKFYLANNGTLFLDEVEAMPLYLQTKLLRVLENKTIERVGGITSIPINIRIIAATNIPLDKMVKKGTFREDLYHRLSVIPLFIPPVRKRGSDVLILANYFIEKFSEKLNKSLRGLSHEVKDIFLNYSWNGNVREIQNTIEYCINITTAEYITKDDLPFQFQNKEPKNNMMTLEEIEKSHIENTLNFYGWDELGRIETAKALGISRSTIYRKIKKYDLVKKSR